MKILCLGHATYDVTFPINEYPKENTKNRFYEKHESIGGPMAVAACLLAKWGSEVYMAGKLGDDAYGNKIKTELAKNRIRTDYIQISDKFQTSHSFNLANASNGDRTLFIYTTKNDPMDDFELDFEPDIILVDGHEFEQSKKMLLKYPKALTIMDAGRDKNEVLELAKMVKYLVCSREFAESVTGIKIDFEDKQTLVKLYQKMEILFKGKVIITLEENGCLYRMDNKIKLMPSVKVKTVDSTGAGDIFHGAFTYGMANNFDFEKSLKYANLAGALSVTKVGGYDSIPALKDLEEIYEQIK